MRGQSLCKIVRKTVSFSGVQINPNLLRAATLERQAIHNAAKRTRAVLAGMDRGRAQCSNKSCVGDYV